MSPNASRSSGSRTPLRFAHPFFTATPPQQRPADFSRIGQRMTDWVSRELGPIPTPRTADSVLDLEHVIGTPGVQEITDQGEITFHAVGDTGRPKGADTSQEDVAQQMTADYSPQPDAKNPAFFLHLGDVVYGPNKDAMYRDEFYRPYMTYPGKIIALAGNHDGEVFDETDPEPLRAFLANFCAENAVVPPAAAQARIFRETMIQPGVYFRLRAPFVDIIALYSNIAEGPGNLGGASDDATQTTWLQTTLKEIGEERRSGTRRALVIATHHPAYSNAGHSGSPDMLADIEAALTAAGIAADAFLAGHAHNYQRHTRVADGTPFIVAGCGGNSRQAQQKPSGGPDTEHRLERFFEDYGYLHVSVSATALTIDFHAAGSELAPLDSVTIPLGG